MPIRPPKLLSPQGHRRVDTFVFPGGVAMALLTARRAPTLGMLMLFIAAGEGAAMLTTNYPPPVAGSWISLRQHVRIANLHGIFAFALALLVPGLRRRDRAAVLGLGAVPLVLNALTDVRDPPPHPRINEWVGSRTVPAARSASTHTESSATGRAAPV